MNKQEVVKAMHELAPVKYDGVVYDRISAYIYRVFKTRDGSYTDVLQCELEDRSGNSVSIVRADKVELAEVKTDK